MVTHWNHEWLTGQEGWYFSAEKCPKHKKKRKKNAWVTSGTRWILPGGSCWQQRPSGVFSCRACQLVKWRRSSRLVCVLMGNINVRVFTLLAARSLSTETEAALLLATSSSSFRRVSLCLCVFLLNHSSSVILISLGVGNGMQSVIDPGLVECLLSQNATHWLAVCYLFKETCKQGTSIRGSS